ncbi:hypothetical protein ABZ914_24540, partial [Spirillospora sp. NPDC046719]
FVSTNLRSDPGRIRRLSGRLDALLAELDEQWRELADALGELVDEIVVDDTEILALDLDPKTEGEIYRVLEKRLAHELSAHGRITRDLLVDVSRRLAGIVEIEVGPPHFAENGHLQENLRKELRRQIIGLLDIGRDAARPIAEELLRLAVASRHDFLKQ